MPDNTSVDLKFESANNGSVSFAPDVLATIAGISLTEVEGIEKSRKPVTVKSASRGIKVDVKDKTVNVAVSVVVEYGYPVPEVCREIQEGIKKNIEQMTGMNVKNVDVHVTGLSFAKENREAAGIEYKNYLLGQKEEEAAEADAPKQNAQSAEE